MKKTKQFLFVIALVFSAICAKAQTAPNWYSPDMLFDTTIVDGIGNKYTLNDILIDTVSLNGSGQRTQLAACSGTNAGYFDLYLQPGCGFEAIPGNPTQSAINAQRLSVLCQLFIDLSNFITNRGGNPNRVRIWVRECTPLIPSPASSGVGAVGSSFFSYPYAPAKGGIIDSEIWKTINSGQDSYKSITSPLTSTGSFYHGQIAFNFYNSSILWHDNLSTVTTSTLIDLYTIGLHEMTHALGFLSLVNYNGTSMLSPNGNYFARYDLNLKTQGGANVITNSGGCSMYSYSVNPAFANPTNTLSPGSATCGTLPSTGNVDVTTCSTSIMYTNAYNVNVYTPNCYEKSSSLSHFEDMCYPTNTPANNNQYFVMSNATGPGLMKRYLKEEERKVLCEIGYTVAATYGSVTYTTTQKTYTAGACNGLSVIGLNDGLGSTGNYTITTTVGVATGVISPLTNDLGVSGGSYECLEIVNGTGTLQNTAGTSFTYNPSSSGLHLLRYVPKNSAGTVKGNITYIYVKVVPNSSVVCSTANNCEMVYNGGFESASTTCGSSWLSTGFATDCWSVISGGWNYFIRNCSTPSLINANTPSAYTIPNFGVDTHNGTPNDRYLSSRYNTGIAQVIQGMTTTSLVPSSQYKISFWVNPEPDPANPNLNMVVSLATSTAPVVGPILNPTVLPAPYTSLETFTVVPDGNWHNCSALITFTGSVASQYVSIVPLYAMPSTSTNPLFWVDDVSILPSSAACSFAVPPITCMGTSFTLNPLVSVPGGAFSGLGVSNTGGTYVFNSNTAGLGLKTISYTYTTASGCTLTAVAQTSVVTQPTLITVFANPPAGLCASYPTATITAGGATTYTFTDGTTTTYTNPAVVSPGSTTTYTIIGANATCSLSTTYTVDVTAACLCVATNTVPSTLNTTTLNLSTGYSLQGGVTVTGGNVAFIGVDMRCSPGSSITVASGATLTITQSHLYSCFDMWKGIIVQDGGYLNINTSLIEDAEKAVEIDNNTSTTGKVLDVSQTTFNHNYISIGISNYTQTASTTYTCFSIKSTVFTSRDFTFTPISWPTQGVLSATCSVTNPLASPYCIGNFPVTPLKAPNSSDYAYFGITVLNVGATINPSTTPTYYFIPLGDAGQPANANIFDNLMYSISATNSNARVAYNVFQNTRSKQVHGNWLGGIAVESNSDDAYNNYLMVKSQPPFQTTRKNKFYDCTYSVKTNNIFEHDIQFNVVQSTQSVSAAYQQGKYGFFVTTNRFKKCDISNNIILNNENGITFYSTYGAVSFGASSYTNTQYSNTVNIVSNNISPVATGPIVNEFVSNAITAQNVLSSGSTQTVNAGANINILTNTLTKVYRGINASNFYTPPVFIASNNCTMAIDPGLNLQQGIAITTCSNASVQLNSIVGPTAPNSITSGIYAADNNTPKVTCNTVQSTYQGFEFSGNQPGTKWKGNSMTTHTLGFVLSNTAVIGAQGSAGNPIDNTWNGTWTGTIFNTWCNSSTVTASPLYVQSTGVYYPNNNDGFPQAPSYYLANQVFTTTGAYSCAGGGARMMASNDDEQSFYDVLESIADYNLTTNNAVDPANYIAQYRLYRILDNNRGLLAMSQKLSDFYYNNTSSAFGKLLDGENYLIDGNYSSAVSSANSIGNKNSIETNYSDFYDLYRKYYTKTFDYDLDNKSLFTLANKCPFTEGEVIYQARTLYNVINSTVETFKDNCPDNSSSRLSQSNSFNNWDVNIYPNPATNELYIRTKNESETLKIQVMDVNGRLIADYDTKTNATISNIKLDLISGIYFVTLSNSNGEKVTKKLVIAK